MNNFNRIYLLLLLALATFANSCTDTLQNTKEIEIISDKTTLEANDADFTKLNLNFSSSLVQEQEIKFTVSNGYLLSFPISNWDQTEKELVLMPNSDTVSLILKTNNIADPNVILTTEYNDQIIDNEFVFTRSCPEQIYVELNNSVVPKDQATLNFSSLLYKEHGVVSKGNKFDIMIYQNDSLLRKLLPIFLDTTENEFMIDTKLDSIGNYHLKILSDINNCSTTFEEDFYFEIIE